MRCAALLLLGAASCGARGELEAPAELAVRNARIYTLDSSRPWAQAFAVRAGRFLFVGDEEDLEEHLGPATRVVDAGGRLLLPAFVDAHVHALDGGIEFAGLQLGSARSPAEIAQRVAERARSHPAEEWIVGTGWDQSLFPGGQPPAGFLDGLELDRPVLLYAGDGGHSAWADRRALAIAGIGPETPDPPDGWIVRDPASGEPTGLLRESAVALVAQHLPAPGIEESEAGLERALAELARVGVVTYLEASAGPRAALVYRLFEEEGRLSARVRLALSLPHGLDPGEEAERLEWIRATRAELDGPLLAAPAVKLFLDGVIEGRTAALLEPYLDAQGEPDAELGAGPAIYEQGELDRLVGLLDAEGFQIHMHAIGDRAVRMGLDAVARARQANGEQGPLHHLAHVQLVDPADLPRFRALGVGAVVQGLWAEPDGYITELTEPVLGPPRSRWIYPIRSLCVSGALVAGGSDWPVTSPAPLLAIQVALTRKSPGAPESPAWIPQERAELSAMLAAYTLDAARLLGMDREIGSIEPEKLADFVLLERDIFAIPQEEIGAVRVLWTVRGGEELHREQRW